MTRDILTPTADLNNLILYGLAIIAVLILYIMYKLSNDKTRGLIPLFVGWLSSVLAIVYRDIEGFVIYLIGKAEGQMVTAFDEAAFDNAIRIAVKAAVFIAIVSFIGTYRATANYALLHGFGFASYGVPIAIDLFVILLGYVIYAFSMAGTKQSPLLSIGLFAMAGLSTYINIQHARQADESVSFSITILGAVFPVILALAIELVSMLNRLRLRRSTLIKSESDLLRNIENRTNELSELESQISDAKKTLSEIRAKQKSETKPQKVRKASPKTGKEKVRKLHDEGLPPVEIIRQTGLANSTVYGYIGEFNRNGNGSH